MGAVVGRVRKESADLGPPGVDIYQRSQAWATATSRYPAQRQEAQAVQVVGLELVSPVRHRVSSVR